MDGIFDVVLYDKKAGQYIVLLGDTLTNTYRLMDLNTWQELSRSDDKRIVSDLMSGTRFFDKRDADYNDVYDGVRDSQVICERSYCVDYKGPIFTGSRDKRLYIVEISYLAAFLQEIAEYLDDGEPAELILVFRSSDHQEWHAKIRPLERLPRSFAVNPTFSVLSSEIQDDELMFACALTEIDVFNWLKVHGIKHSLLKVINTYVSEWTIRERMILAFIENELSEVSAGGL